MRIVVVHGVGQQLGGEDTLLQVWLPGLRDGLRRTEPRLAEADLPGPGDVRCAFSGDLFRPPGAKAGLALPPYDALDVEDGFERELLDAWWREAARVDPGVPDPAAPTKVRTPRAVQRALKRAERLAVLRRDRRACPHLLVEAGPRVLPDAGDP